MLMYETGKWSTRYLLDRLLLFSSLVLFQSAEAYRVIHTTPDGYVFIAFWLLFLLLSFLATITFVLFYASAHSIRSTLLQDVFQNVEYDLLDDFSSAEPEWIDIGKRQLKTRTAQVSKSKAGRGLMRKNSLDSEKGTKGAKHSSEEKTGKATKLENGEDADDAKANKHSSEEKVGKVTKPEGGEDGKANKHSSEEKAKIPESGENAKAHKPGNVEKSGLGIEEKVAKHEGNDKPGQSKKSESD